MKKYKIIRYGIKTKEGIVLVGHNAIPIMNRTRKETKLVANHKGDKVVKIVIEER